MTRTADSSIYDDFRFTGWSAAPFSTLLAYDGLEGLQEKKIQAFYDEIDEIFEPLLKWGLIRDKFASLVTDSLRGKWLENAGYKVDMLEFIDESHTPKNLLIRAVKSNGKNKKNDKNDIPKLITSLQISPEIWK